MKITIIPSDGAVYKDGYSYGGLDVSNVPANVHALQFDDASNAGWIEFTQNNFEGKDANQTITSLPEWAITAMTKWDEAKAKELAAIEAAKIAEALEAERIAKNQPVTSGVETA